MKAFILALLAGHASSLAAPMVQPSKDGAVGFRVVNEEANSEGRYEAIEIAVSTIIEMGADGEPVGIGAPPLFILDSDNISVSSEAGSGVYQDDLLVNEVGNDTVRVDVRISDWTFCTPFGRDGGRQCLAEPQDILLQNEGALPSSPTPPPPHTLLIPRCDGETVATFRFVCDPRVDGCTDVVSVKFYLGEADQDPGQAPNTATIGGRGNGTSSSSSNAEADALEEFGGNGVYEHNLTIAEVEGFLNVSSLTPGLDYVFWSVWEHGNGSAPESNSQEFDLSRTQYWQCPGTTIERNFEVGTSLSVSLVVNGSTALVPLCEGSSSPSSSSGSSAASSSSCQQYSTSARVDGTTTRGRRLRVTGQGSRYPSLPLPPATRDRLLQEVDQSTSETAEEIAEGGESWAWDEDGPTLGLGELSRIRLASHVLLLRDDGGEAWGELRNTSSVAPVAAESDGEGGGPAGVVTASLQSFGVREAVFSTMLFFVRVEAVEEASGSRGGIGSDIATWVAIAFGVFLLWMLGCCSFRLKNESHAAKTWPADMARATARAKGGFDTCNESTFGSPSGSEADCSMDGVKELQIFPMIAIAAAKPSISRSEEEEEGSGKSFTFRNTSSEEDAESSYAPPIEAPGWTTPGSGSAKHNTKTNESTTTAFNKDPSGDDTIANNGNLSTPGPQSHTTNDNDSYDDGINNNNDDDNDVVNNNGNNDNNNNANTSNNDHDIITTASEPPPSPRLRRLPKEAFPLTDVV
eukprot:g5806.t1